MYQRLVGDRHFQHAAPARVEDALAAQARVEARVAGAVYEIFFLVRYFWYKILTVFQVYMTGAAGAYHTAVVMQCDIVVQRYLQDTLVALYIFQCYRFQSFLLKFECNSVHENRIA